MKSLLVKAAFAATLISLSAAAQVSKAGVVERLRLPSTNPESFAVTVGLDGRPARLELTRYEIRSPGFRLLVQDATGLHPAKPAPCVTYRGSVAGLPGSSVAASLVAGRLNAVIMLQGDEVYGIEPVGGGAPLSAHRVYHAGDAFPNGVFCGTKVPFIPAPRGGGSLSPTGTKVAELAIDADYDFYQKFGSVTKTQNQVNSVMNAVDTIYKRDVGITYKITALIVRTTRVYSSTTSISTRLGQFRSRWNSTHAGIKRDMAHIFTGVGSFSGVVGVAYVGVVCSTRVAYGASKAFSRSLTTNAGLVSHEMGHNWGAGHCDSRGSDCKIMCSRLGGCGRNLAAFGTGSQARIISFRNSRSCLDDSSPPVLTGISPSSVQALGPTTVTLTGSGLSSVTKVLVGTMNVTSFSSSGPTSLTFTAPIPSTLGKFSVRAGNSRGLSNALSLTFTATHPPKHTASPVGYPKLVPIDFVIGSKAKGLWVLIVSGSKQTIPFLGYNLLKNFAVLSGGGLDAAGIARLRVPVLISLKGQYIYSQAATFANLSFVGLSKVASTLVY